MHNLHVVIERLAMVLTVLTGLIMASDYMKKTKLGVRMLDTIEASTIHLVYQRAVANKEKDIFTVRQVFPKITTFLIIVIAALAYINSLSPIPLIFIGLPILILSLAEASFEWTFNHKKTVKSQAIVYILVILSPFILLTLEQFPGSNIKFYSTKPLSNPQILPFTITPLLLASAMSIFSALIMLIIYLGSWFILGPFAFLVLGFMRLSTMGSRILVLRANREIFRNIVWITFVVSSTYYMLISLLKPF